MTRLRYAVIGTGHRAEMYISAIRGPFADIAELVALCDPNPVRAAVYRDDVGDGAGAAVPSLWHPDQFEIMIAHESIDRVVITARDDAHADLVVRALHCGVRVILEKPLAVDSSGAAAIERAVHDTGGEVVLTFNYRYSPRNTALRGLIADGAIGSVTSIDFSWMLDTRHGADYFRRWHRDKQASGGLLVHKASHHFDLVNWWIAAIPVRVFASGGLRFYGAANARARGMTNRPERGTHDGEHDPFQLNLRDDPRLRALYLDAEAHDGYHRDRDVFSEGISIEDNLALIAEYDSGVTLSYSLNAHAPWEGYRIAVNGTEGRAELDVVERGAIPDHTSVHWAVDPSAAWVADPADALRPAGERLTLQRHWQQAAAVPIAAESGSHGGGDDRMLADIFRGSERDRFARAATWIDGVRATGVGLAGNRSLATGLPVALGDLGIPLLDSAGSTR